MEVLPEAMPVVCESVTSIIALFFGTPFLDTFQLGAHRRTSAEVGLANNICKHTCLVHLATQGLN